MAKAESVSVELSMTEGKHNKTYLVWLRERYADGLWTVDFAYGRIGTLLKHGTKTEQPVSYSTAKVVYDNLVQSKLAKGYKKTSEKSLPVFTNGTTWSESPKTSVAKASVAKISEEPRGRKFRDAY